MNEKISLSIILIITVIIKSLKVHKVIDLLCLFMTCFVMSYTCFKNIIDSIKYAIFLVIVFELLRILLTVNNNIFSEKLTNPNKEETKTEIKETNNSDEINELHKENELEKELEDLDKHLVKLNGKDEEYDKKLSIQDMAPAQAQRELYRLVDTTNLLKKTMTEMAPVINEGKKIMKSIEALNILN